MLRIVAPRGNKQGGRFIGSQHLLPQLNRFLTEVHADQRADLLGGYVATRRRRRKARAARGRLALAGLVDRRTDLRGVREDRQYKASLRRDGRIRYKRELYDTPNAAARAALKRPADGWSFWRFRAKGGKWTSLRALKR
ncbi:MAG: hypothetical protein HYX89_07315 [Chloroflexi bacterium]|nr:hypothetical protein [Chloroflexota bacterium]